MHYTTNLKSYNLITGTWILKIPSIFTQNKLNQKLGVTTSYTSSHKKFNRRQKNPFHLGINEPKPKKNSMPRNITISLNNKMVTLKRSETGVVVNT